MQEMWKAWAADADRRAAEYSAAGVVSSNATLAQSVEQSTRARIAEIKAWSAALKSDDLADYEDANHAIVRLNALLAVVFREATKREPTVARNWREFALALLRSEEPDATDRVDTIDGEANRTYLIDEYPRGLLKAVRREVEAAWPRAEEMCESAARAIALDPDDPANEEAYDSVVEHRRPLFQIREALGWEPAIGHTIEWSRDEADAELVGDCDDMGFTTRERRQKTT